MKTENIKWCVDKVGWDAPDTSDTEAAQKALAAAKELDAMQAQILVLESLLRDALASDFGWEDSEWGPKAAELVGRPFGS